MHLEMQDLPDHSPVPEGYQFADRTTLKAKNPYGSPISPPRDEM